VEAVHIRRPSERAYLTVKDEGMRGIMLFNYLDEELELLFPPKKRGAREDPVIQGMRFKMDQQEYKEMWLKDQE
jgi:hypothetical protein